MAQEAPTWQGGGSKSGLAVTKMPTSLHAAMVNQKERHMQKITKIGIISLGKLTGASGFLLGLIIGVLYGMAAILFGVIGGASGQADAGSMAAVGIIGGIFASTLASLLLIPCFYQLLDSMRPRRRVS